MKLRNVALVLSLAACGGGKDDPPIVVVDSNNPTPDVPVRPPPPPGCDYGEFEDVSNDILFTDAGASENTSLTFSQTTVICGKFDIGHFLPGENPGDVGLLDADVYSVDVGADAEALVTVSGAGLEGLEQVDVLAITQDADPRLLGEGTFRGNHGVFSGTLPAGTIGFAVFAATATEPTAALDYKIRVTVDNPNTRCAPSTAPASGNTGFTEAGDGAQNIGNNMVEVRFSPDTAAGEVGQKQTDSAADSPELTNHTTSAGSSFHIAGTTANADFVDEYNDPDTYEIKTGADTHQLTVRLDWTGTTSDHDFIMFPKVAAAAPIAELLNATGTLIGDSGPEFVTFAVEPNTDLWIWTGTYDTLSGGGAPTLPSTYDITVCGEGFTAP